jgi:hypothetical protein
MDVGVLTRLMGFLTCLNPDVGVLKQQLRGWTTGTIQGTLFQAQSNVTETASSLTFASKVGRWSELSGFPMHNIVAHGGGRKSTESWSFFLRIWDDGKKWEVGGDKNTVLVHGMIQDEKGGEISVWEFACSHGHLIFLGKKRQSILNYWNHI